MRNKDKIKALIKAVCTLISLIPLYTHSDVWEPVANGVNGNDTALTPVKFARELFADGSVRISPGFATYNLGKSLDEPFVAIFSIEGGSWGIALTSASLSLDDVDGSGSSATIRLVEGGGLDDTSARFRIEVSSELTAGDELTLGYTLVDTSGLAKEGRVTLAIRLNDVLGKISGSEIVPGIVAESVEAISILSSTAGFSGGLDLRNELTSFSNTIDPLEIKLLELTIADGAGVNDGVEDDGVTPFNLQVGDVALRDGKIEVSGSFNASLSVDQDGDMATNDGLRITGCIDRSASSLTSSLGIFELTGAEVSAMQAGGTCSIVLRLDGTTQVDEFLGSASFSIDYKNPAYIDEMMKRSLYEVAVNASSTQFLEILLLEESGYSQVVRVVNTGNVDDIVFATLFNDKGESVFFELLSEALAAGSSSKMIPVGEIYQTAVDKNSSFSAGDGKLRLRLSSNAEISARSYITSTDKTNFSRI